MSVEAEENQTAEAQEQALDMHNIEVNTLDRLTREEKERIESHVKGSGGSAEAAAKAGSEFEDRVAKEGLTVYEPYPNPNKPTGTGAENGIVDKRFPPLSPEEYDRGDQLGILRKQVDGGIKVEAYHWRADLSESQSPGFVISSEFYEPQQESVATPSQTVATSPEAIPQGAAVLTAEAAAQNILNSLPPAGSERSLL